MPDTKPAYRITVYRCQCCPGVRYRKAADDHYWAVGEQNEVNLNNRARYTLDELRNIHDGVTAVEVDDLQALLDELYEPRREHSGSYGSFLAIREALREANARIAARDKELALHRMVAEGGIDGLVARCLAAEATVERVKALAEWAASPSTPVTKVVDGYTYTHDQITVEDGGLLLVGESAVYVRTDGDARPHDGDWWLLNGTADGDGPHQLSEILVSRHDEDTDRPITWHNFEALITADMLAQALTEEK